MEYRINGSSDIKIATSPKFTSAYRAIWNSLRLLSSTLHRGTYPDAFFSPNDGTIFVPPMPLHRALYLKHRNNFHGHNKFPRAIGHCMRSNRTSSKMRPTKKYRSFFAYLMCFSAVSKCIAKKKKKKLRWNVDCSVRFIRKVFQKNSFEFPLNEVNNLYVQMMCWR